MPELSPSPGDRPRLVGEDGDLLARLVPFVNQLAACDDHAQVRRWLRRGPAVAALRGMAQGHLLIEHETLDEVAGSRRGRATAIEHLRRLLVASQVRPVRQEHLSRLEPEISARLAALHADDAIVMRRFVTWYTLPRTRCRIAQGRDPKTTCQLARNSLTGPSRLLTHLRGHDLALLELTQGDLEEWVADNPGYVSATVIFLRWARRQKLAPVLVLPTQRRNTPREFSDPQDQWGDRQAMPDRRLVGPTG